MDDRNKIKGYVLVNVKITNDRFKGWNPDDLCDYYHDGIYW